MVGENKRGMISGNQNYTVSNVYVNICFYKTRWSMFFIYGHRVTSPLRKSSSLTSPCTHILYAEITCNADCITHIYRSKAIRAVRCEETKQGLIYKLYRRKPRKGLEEKWRKWQPEKASVHLMDVGVVCYTKYDKWWWGLRCFTARAGKRMEFKWRSN